MTPPRGGPFAGAVSGRTPLLGLSKDLPSVDINSARPLLASVPRKRGTSAFGSGPPGPELVPPLPFLPASTVFSAQCLAGLLHPAADHGVRHVSGSDCDVRCRAALCPHPRQGASTARRSSPPPSGLGVATQPVGRSVRAVLSTIPPRCTTEDESTAGLGLGAPKSGRVRVRRREAFHHDAGEGRSRGGNASRRLAFLVTHDPSECFPRRQPRRVTAALASSPFARSRGPVTGVSTSSPCRIDCRRPRGLAPPSSPLRRAVLPRHAARYSHGLASFSGRLPGCCTVDPKAGGHPAEAGSTRRCLEYRRTGSAQRTSGQCGRPSSGRCAEAPLPDSYRSRFQPSLSASPFPLPTRSRRRRDWEVPFSSAEAFERLLTTHQTSKPQRPPSTPEGVFSHVAAGLAQPPEPLHGRGAPAAPRCVGRWADLPKQLPRTALRRAAGAPTAEPTPEGIASEGYGPSLHRGLGKSASPPWAPKRPPSRIGPAWEGTGREAGVSRVGPRTDSPCNRETRRSVGDPRDPKVEEPPTRSSPALPPASSRNGSSSTVHGAEVVRHSEECVTSARESIPCARSPVRTPASEETSGWPGGRPRGIAKP